MTRGGVETRTRSESDGIRELSNVISRGADRVSGESKSKIELHIISTFSPLIITQMLILPDDDNSIGNGHFDLVMVAPPVIRISVSHVIQHIVVVFAGRPDALWHAHLLADVLHVVALLEYGILLESIRKCWTRHDYVSSVFVVVVLVVGI